MNFHLHPCECWYEKVYAIVNLVRRSSIRTLDEGNNDFEQIEFAETKGTRTDSLLRRDAPGIAEMQPLVLAERRGTARGTSAGWRGRNLLRDSPGLRPVINIARASAKPVRPRHTLQNQNSIANEYRDQRFDVKFRRGIHFYLLHIVAILTFAVTTTGWTEETTFSPTGSFESVFDRIPSLVGDIEPNWLFRDAGEPKADREKEEEPLETDRDSYTFATSTVAPGRALIETAYTFIQNRNVPNTNSYPEMITRIGISDRIELRLGWNYEAGGGGSVTNADAGGDEEAPGKKYESQFSYGLKIDVTKQSSWVPESACIVQASTPTSGPENATRFLLGYAFGWKLLNDWKLDSSMRYESEVEEGDHFNQWAPSVVLKIPVAKSWDVHGEYFGIFTTGRSNNTNEQYFSPGISYLMTPNCEVGIRVGWGLNQDAASFFNNVGIGVRF